MIFLFYIHLVRIEEKEQGQQDWGGREKSV